MNVLPLRSWFLMQPPDDLHGIGHTARIVVWMAALTRGTPWFEPVVRADACQDLAQILGTGFGLVRGFGKCCLAGYGNRWKTRS